MKKKSIQRIAAWLLAASMTAGTFAQPMAVYAESTAPITASGAADNTAPADSTITADADVAISTPATDAAGTDNADTTATPAPTQEPESTAAPETTPDPAAGDAADAEATPTPTPDAGDDTAAPDEDAAGDDTENGTNDDTAAIAPADLQSCMALLSASQLSLEKDSIDPEVREDTLALADEITETSSDTLQALVNAAVLAAPDETNITVQAEPGANYTGTLVIPDASILGTRDDGTTFSVNYTGKTITLDMKGSTLTVPADAAVGVSVFGTLTIENGTIQAADDCTATRGVQVPLGGNLTLQDTTIRNFHYAGPGAGVYVKGTAAVNSDGRFDVMLNGDGSPAMDGDNYKIKKVQYESGADMDTRFTMRGTSTIENCTSNGSGAALYAHNAALVNLESATFTGNDAADNGGAVYLGTGVALTLGEGVVFENNHSAKDGGALYLANQYDLHVKDTTVNVQMPVTFTGSSDDDGLHGVQFTGNNADGNGGALAFDPAFNALADDCLQYITFTNNTAKVRGGAVAFNAAIIKNTVDTCFFTGNTAQCGGAVYYPNNMNTGKEPDPSYTIQNTTFEHNTATGNNSIDGYGGAVVLQMNRNASYPNNYTATFNITGSTFTENSASYRGGAVAVWKEGGNTTGIRMQVTLDGNTFTGNSTTINDSIEYEGGGGAVFLCGNAMGTFTANTFANNTTANIGGAVFIKNDVKIPDRVLTFGAQTADSAVDDSKANTFTDNHADAQGGAIYSGASSDDATTTLFYGGRFESNSSNVGGGAVYLVSRRGRESDAALIDGVTFVDNQGQRTAIGGALYLKDGNYTIQNSTFTNNTTEWNAGGAIYTDWTEKVAVTNTKFDGNIAGATRKSDARGGAIHSHKGKLLLTDDTFTNNEGTSGGAISTHWDFASFVEIRNCNFSGNKGTGSGGVLYSYGGTVEIWDSAFTGNSAASGGVIGLANRDNIAPKYSTLTVHEGCTFTNNQAVTSGGAIYIDTSSTSYEDDNGKLQYYHNIVKILGTEDKPVTFANNTASRYAGAIHLGGRAELTAQHTVFDKNSGSDNGGAIYAGACDTIDLKDSQFTNNTSGSQGGALFVSGALQYATIDGVSQYYPDLETVTVTNCTFTGNKATSIGGAIATAGDLRNNEDLYTKQVGTITLNKNTFDGNSAGALGGALYIYSNWEGVVNGGSITNNTAVTGGALYVRRSNVVVDGGAIIDSNTASGDGGAIYVGYDWGASYKGSIYTNRVTTKKCTISHNTAKRGGVVFVQNYAGFAMEKSTLVDSNIGTGDVYVSTNAKDVTLAKANTLQGEYTAWRMDDTKDLTDAVVNDNTADHYYNLLGGARFVARLNGGLFNLQPKNYTTLQEAITAAQTCGGDATIDLLADVNEKITANTEQGAITLNLNHYTLTGSINLNNAKNGNAFTLTDEKKANAKPNTTAGLFTGVGNGVTMGNGISQQNPNTLVLKNVTLSGFQRVVYGGNYNGILMDGAVVEKYYYAGIRIGDKSNITVKNSIFRDGTANTGYNSHVISVDGRDNVITIEDGEFCNLTAQYGPVVYMNYQNTLTINGGKFHDNTATNWGGVIALNTRDNVVTINGGEFTNNKAAYGGVINTNVSSWAEFRNTVNITGGTFTNNTATANGGVIWMGGAQNGSAVNTLTITGGELSGNTAANGGAVYCDGRTDVTIGGGTAADATATHGVVMNNTASLASNLLLASAGSTLQVTAGGLLYGGIAAGDVLFTNGGHVTLCDVKDLYLNPIVDSTDLAWLKNQDPDGQTKRDEDADAQDCYILAQKGVAPSLYAARVGETRYHSVTQAFDAAKAAEGDQTIYLLRDQTEDLTVTPLRKQVTLNLNGYTLAGQITVNGGMNAAGGCFILADAKGEADYKEGSAGGVLTGNKIGIYVKGQNTVSQEPTVKLQGTTLTLKGFTSHAVFAESQANIALDGVAFTNNTNTITSGSWSDAAGAAICFNGAGTLTAENCRFLHNTTNGYGGAIGMGDRQAIATLTNCNFDSNSGYYGGAVSLWSRNATLTGNTFTNNTAVGSNTNFGGALYLYLYTGTSKVEEKYDAVLRSNTFTGNSATRGYGGAVCLDSDDIDEKLLLDRNTFTQNSTPNGDGGAFYARRGAVTLGAGNQFIENWSYGSGSAICLYGDGNYYRTSLYSVYEDDDAPDEADYTLFKDNRIGVDNYGEVNGTVRMNFGPNYTLRYAKFTDNQAVGTGASTIGVYAGGGTGQIPDRTVTIDHCTFTGNTGGTWDLRFADNYAPNSQITVSNVVIDGDTITSRDYAVVYVDRRNNFTMDHVTIQNIQGQARILLLYGGALDGNGEDSYNGFKPVYHTLNDVKILNNNQCYDAPIYLTSANNAQNDTWKRYSGQGITTMTNCEISNNTCTRSDRAGAGAMYIEKTMVTMTDCKVNNNQGGNGTIRVIGGNSDPVGYGPQNECALTLENCEITGNTSRNAAVTVGVRDCRRETLNIRNSNISGNTNTTESGGAVHGGPLSTLNIADSTLNNNTAALYGGAVYAEAYDTADGASRTNLTNCTITGNKAQYGGGVYLLRFALPDKYSNNKDIIHAYTTYGNTSQSLMIKNGVIRDNTATANGGGICLDTNRYDTRYCTMKVHVSGTSITGNRAQLGQDVYAYKAVPATELYLPRASDIAANSRWLNEDTGLVLPDQAVEYGIIQRTYPLTLSVPQPETGVACLLDADGNQLQIYDSLQAAMDDARARLAGNPETSLTVQLLQNTNSSTLVSAGTNVTLDLNGCSITGIGGSSALTIEDSTILITGGTISGTASDGGALQVRNNAKVTLTHTTLTGSRAARYGGAAYLSGGASLTMAEDAVITGCEAAYGGAVYVKDGTFTQTSNAKIDSCKAFTNNTFQGTSRGSAVYVEKGIYDLTEEAAVTGCSGASIGTVFIANYGEFNMTGGEISGNKADSGAGVYLAGSMTIVKGKITGNTARYTGGGIYQAGGTALMRGGEISGNTAANGAGWRLGDSGSALMRDGVITGNNASVSGGGIYQDSGTFTVNGGEITKNEAAAGGGLRHSNGTFNFQGGALYGNTARDDGGSGSDIDATGQNGVVNLAAVSAMKNEKYNVWRDDRYPYPFTEGYHKTSDKIASKTEPGGKYLTAEVTNVNDVKLTADYYGGENTEIASNDMYVSSLELKAQDSGNYNSDAYDKDDGVITARDVYKNGAKVEGVASVTESKETYPLNYASDGTTKTAHYLTVHYSDGREEEDVRPDTPLAWTAGNDKNSTNRLLRSFSTAHYAIDLVTQSAEMKEKLANTTQRLWIRIKVPCENGEVSIKGIGKQFTSSLSYYDPTLGCMILEGYQDLALTKEQASSIVNASQQFTITVGGMHNGDRLEPTIEAWFDNSSYNNYETENNHAKNMVSLDADPMVISAKAAYNLAIENQPDVKRLGYFDIEQKVEITEEEYKARKAAQDPDVVYGMVAGYGMALQLRNQDSGKSLRGIEVPTGDITFSVGMHGSMFYDGKQVYNKDGSPVSIEPILWAYKPNDRGQSQTGYDTRDNKAGINMYWNDEDDITKDTTYDPKMAPNVAADHSGGVWSVTKSSRNDSYDCGGGQTNTQTKATFHVSGYNMKPIGSIGNGAYTFSAGYLQVIIPIDLENYDIGDTYDGFLQADLRVVADEFSMDGISPDQMNGIEPTIKDNINSYYNFGENELESLKRYATNETTYKDNYNKSETLGINISKSESGNGSYLYKTTYWLGSDGSTVLNDAGKKELGTNVTGVGSQLYMVGNMQFISESITPANDAKRYLYDQQVDEQTEYYYLTGFDVLMKFDPDAMEPLTYRENGVEKSVTKWSAAEVKQKLAGISMINLSDTGYSDWDTGAIKLTQDYELTILYAAKNDDTSIGNGNDGNGWVYDQWTGGSGELDNSQPLWQGKAGTRDNGGTADMDAFSFDNTTETGNYLVYYDTLDALKKDGKTCVAVLYQVRNCCIRNGREVSVGHMMQVSDAVNKLGRSYAVTMDMRGWTTYRPFYRDPVVGDPGWQRLQDKDGNMLQNRRSLLYQGLITGDGSKAEKPKADPVYGITSKTEWNIGQPTVSKPDTNEVNGYSKTQYSNGYEVGGSHSGYKGGNTVLIATQNATIDVTTTDEDHGNISQHDYLLDSGQRTVTVEVTPDIKMQSNVKKDLTVFDGRTETDIEVTVTLPCDLTLQQGTVAFNYANSSYKQGDLIWDMQYQYQDEDGSWKPFDFKTDYAEIDGYKQRTTRLRMTTTITDAQKTLPTFSFKAAIGYPADPEKDIQGTKGDSGTWYQDLTIRAEIHSTYEDKTNDKEVNAALGREDSTTITVYRNSLSVINKTAQENLVEVGSDLVYTLTYQQSDPDATLELCDVLPYDSTAFHGAYALKSVSIKVNPTEGSAVWKPENLTLKYGDSTDVVLGRGVLDRGNTLQKSLNNGKELSDTNCTIETGDNSIRYTPNYQLVHYAAHASALGTLYFKMTNVPQSTVQIIVTLTPKETTAEGNRLLDDNGTTQQPGDTYSNVYFSKLSATSYITSPAASIKVRSRSISGLAWLDQNHDGVYTTKLTDTGENIGSDKLLTGITVTLLQKDKTNGDPLYIADGTYYYAVTDTLGNTVVPVKTDEEGRYTFANLPAGNYRVLFTDADSSYKMEGNAEPVMPFGKLSLTKVSTAATSNKAKAQWADDGTTLQAGLTDTIKLGNAELTGRDDRSNVNAGFYYTELRLAKEWKNMPDLETAAKAKVTFTLTATDAKNKLLDTASYTMSNKAISSQKAEKDSLFGSFQKDSVTAEDHIEARRTVRWVTDSGLALQAENAAGPITYKLTGEQIEAKNNWVASAAFIQNLTQEEVSSGPDSDNSTIATRYIAENTAMTYDVEITKLSDLYGKNIPGGAKFEAKCKESGVTRNSEEVKVTEDEGTVSRYLLKDLSAGAYTLRESKAPFGYAKDRMTYTLIITDKDEQGKPTEPMIELRDKSGHTLYTASIKPDSPTVEVVKDPETETSASAVMTGGSCLETYPESNLPIRTQIDLSVTDTYLFSLPFTGGSGMNRTALAGAALMGLAAVLAATVTIRKRKKGRADS